MVNVVFVVPFALETTLRFVRAVANLPDVRLAVISQEPAKRLPEELLAKLVAHEQVADPLDAGLLVEAVRKLSKSMEGRVDRLLGILEQLQEPMAEVRELLGIRGMALQTAHNFRDKARMKDLFREHGLPCARHQLATTREEALAFARECLPLVAKPPAGAGARNTMRVDSIAELEGYLRTVPPRPNEPLLLEEFVQGREYSFDSVSLGGKHLFHSISSYHPTPLEVMRSPWVQWCVLLPRDIDDESYDDIREAGRRALRVLGMVTGLTHMEWFRRPDGSIAISEVAARPPGAQFTTLLSYAHDRDFYAAWAELVVHERFQAPQRQYAAGAVFLRGQGGDRVEAVHGIEAAQAELGDLIVQAKIPKPGQPAATTYEGEGYVILRHPRTEVVEQGLDRVLQLLRVELSSS